MSSMRMSKEGRRRVGERKEIFPNANKFSTKRELAMKWLHNIGSPFFVRILHTAPSGSNIGVCAVRNGKGA